MSLIKKPSDPVLVKSIRVLLYGQPGIRKTSWSLTCNNPLLFDFDQGVHRVRPEDRRDYISMTSWEEAEQALSEDLSGYNTIIIDTAGKALDLLMISIVNENPKNASGGQLSQRGWGVLRDRFTMWRRRVEALGKNLVFIAHDKEERGSEDGEKIVRPDISGGTLKLLIRDMDLMGYMESRSNIPVVNFSASDKSWGKNTANLPSFINVGEITLEQVFDIYRTQQLRQSELRVEYEKLIADCTVRIIDMENPNEFKDFAKHMEGVEHIWASKKVIGLMFSSRVKEVGYKFNRETLEYEQLPIPA